MKTPTRSRSLRSVVKTFRDVEESEDVNMSDTNTGAVEAEAEDDFQAIETKAAAVAEAPKKADPHPRSRHSTRQRSTLTRLQGQQPRISAALHSPSKSKSRSKSKVKVKSQSKKGKERKKKKLSESAKADEAREKKRKRKNPMMIEEEMDESSSDGEYSVHEEEEEEDELEGGDDTSSGSDGRGEDEDDLLRHHTQSQYGLRRSARIHKPIYNEDSIFKSLLDTTPRKEPKTELEAEVLALAGSRSPSPIDFGDEDGEESAVITDVDESGSGNSSESDSESDAIVSHGRRRLQPPRKMTRTARGAGGGGSSVGGGGTSSASPKTYSLRRKSKPVERFHFDSPRHGSRHLGSSSFPPRMSRRRTSSRAMAGSGQMGTPRQRLRHRHRRHSMSDPDLGSSSSSESEWEDRQRRTLERMRSRMAPVNAAQLPGQAGAPGAGDAALNKADLQPMFIDKTVSWNSIGGLDDHIQSLKEMVVLPLLYPELFQKFGVSPPRGVLFSGPPGTGKTLVARALANMCSQEGRPVAFFMRKGADCLSKWVGESERQLRMLFDQAHKMQPSIIFFDEIDGLCPVRSARQDQIHSSIVSTVLALMDGLDARGQVVIIGATNRIDAIDPALRRPGRFDREFAFPLPNRTARHAIVGIHTQNWQPRLDDAFMNQIAVRTVGYSGADLKGLCTEAVLHALKRRYPQIYHSDDKLQIDTAAVSVDPVDFDYAIQAMTPSAQRSASAYAFPLSAMFKPLLSRMVGMVVDAVGGLVPAMGSGIAASRQLAVADAGTGTGAGAGAADSATSAAFSSAISVAVSDREFDLYAGFKPAAPHRPRLLVCGSKGAGQAAVCGAALHVLEEYPVYSIGMAALFQNVSSRSVEEALVMVFHEAQRRLPAILYWPQADLWWSMASDALKGTLVTLMESLSPTLPLLLLGTAEGDTNSIDDDLSSLFGVYCSVLPFNDDERREFFAGSVRSAILVPAPLSVIQQEAEVLPKAALPPPPKPTAEELLQQEKDEEGYLRQLRMMLRDIIVDIRKDRRFAVFVKPVDPEDAPDYYSIIKTPLCLDEVHDRIDDGVYASVAAFSNDIDIICNNAREYNPIHHVVCHRAEDLRDRINSALFDLDPKIVDVCTAIEKRRDTDPDRYLRRQTWAQQVRRNHALKNDELAVRIAEARRAAGFDGEDHGGRRGGRGRRGSVGAGVGVGAESGRGVRSSRRLRSVDGDVDVDVEGSATMIDIADSETVLAEARKLKREMQKQREKEKKLAQEKEMEMEQEMERLHEAELEAEPQLEPEPEPELVPETPATHPPPNPASATTTTTVTATTIAPESSPAAGSGSAEAEIEPEPKPKPIMIYVPVPPTVAVELEERADTLADLLVTRTRSHEWTAERLARLRSAMDSVLYAHKRSGDRVKVLEELEDLVPDDT